MTLSAHQFPAVHAANGIDLSQLGCVMLTTESIDAVHHVPEMADSLYTSLDPKKFWIKGNVGAHENAHVTLLYGLITPAYEQKALVDQVLQGWEPEPIVIDHVGVFPSPYKDDDYVCIVAHLKMTENLLEAHARLSFLPHIDTFPGYKAHVTLAYVRTDAHTAGNWVQGLDRKLAGLQLSPIGIDYGSNK